MTAPGHLPPDGEVDVVLLMPAIDTDVGAISFRGCCWRKVDLPIAVKGALREFQRDTSRLVDDPELATLSDMRINHLVTRGMPMAEAIRTAGRALYEKFGWSALAPERPAPGPAAVFVSTTRADKLKAKQDLDPVQGRSIAATAASDENTPETTSDVIAQMRRARGQI